MERTDRLPQRIEGRFPVASWSGHRVLVGVSGGSDSVALLRAVQSLGHPGVNGSAGTGVVPCRPALPAIHVAHFNHRWRGSESDGDEQFVSSLCQQLGLTLHLGHAPRATDPARATEQSARRQRHQFLRETAELCAARFVLTAHTRNDQIETILFRLLRGTGLRGLAGIRPRRLLSPAVTLVRPMLDATRREVLEYLASIGQSFRDDSSNTDCRYLRNRIRHQLLPLLARDYFPDSPNALARLAEQAGELGDWLDDVVAQELDQSLHIDPDHFPPTRITFRFRPDQRALVRVEMVRAAWRQASWPERSMAERHWRALVEPPAARRWPAGRSFPAHVTARWLDSTRLVLSRPPRTLSPLETTSPSPPGAQQNEPF